MEIFLAVAAGIILGAVCGYLAARVKSVSLAALLESKSAENQALASDKTASDARVEALQRELADVRAEATALQREVKILNEQKQREEEQRRKEFDAHLEAVKENFYAGPYAKYASKYLGVDARQKDEVTYTLSRVKMTSYAEADLSKRFLIDLRDELAYTSFLKLTASGLVSSPEALSGRELVWRFPVIAAGDYTRKVNVHGQDEVAQLGKALNALGNDLSAFVAKTERAEKIRRDFVANVSHELRTPLTIIRGYNEAISDGTVTDKDMIQRYRLLINEETMRLERMIRELLDISRMQAADELAPAKMQPLPLGAIVRNVAEKLMVNAVERNVKLLVHVDEKIQIMGQGDQMVQLVLIIGDNALKYTPENGTVTFVTELQQDGSVKMAISDQGPGIPEEDLPFIWERFYKVDKSHSRNVPGTGLGLAIAREIIRMHGAKVQVFSKLGEGTRFEITFPKDKVISE